MQIVCAETAIRDRALAGWAENSGDGAWADFWQRLIIVGEAQTSQYDDLRTRPLKPATDAPEAHVALSGRNFHGQRRRPWRAVPGNLHLSITTPLDLPAGPEALTWTMLPAVAVMEALRHLEENLPHDLGIKWVNDILCRGRKVGGVLSSVIQDGGRVRRGHLGIGVNIEVAPDLPGATQETPTDCLASWLAPPERGHGRVLQAILAALARNIQLLAAGQGADIAAAYRADSLVVGRRVRILADPLEGPGRELARGRVLAVGEDLTLTLEGRETPVSSGRLFLLPEGPGPGD